ncbi:MAG TPA: zinc-binding dehydrogenase [Acidimicrobiales bacterium]|nr:zinc-binding dehydrogenase [Acidimicrobiales bacterium]
MRAVTIADGDLHWAEHPDPEPGDGELLVAVRAAGLNAADLLQRVDLYPAPAGFPQDIPGMEFAGEVMALGRGTARFAVGDRVMAVVGGGAQAELTVVDERCCMAVPENISWDEAGGFPEAFSTAYDALFTQCQMSLGDSVLVTGAAGGVGTAAVQLTAACGARATASVRSAELRDAVAALGAAEALGVEEALARGPFDVAIELVGGPSLPGVLGAMDLGGRIAVIGVGAGGRAELDLLALMQRRARISGSTLRARSSTEKAVVARAVESHVLPLLTSGGVRVPVLAIYQMERAAEAYERFAAGGKLGKIVLVPS